MQEATNTGSKEIAITDFDGVATTKLPWERDVHCPAPDETGICYFECLGGRKVPYFNVLNKWYHSVGLEVSMSMGQSGPGDDCSVTVCPDNQRCEVSQAKYFDEFAFLVDACYGPLDILKTNPMQNIGWKRPCGQQNAGSAIRGWPGEKPGPTDTELQCNRRRIVGGGWRAGCGRSVNSYSF